MLKYTFLLSCFLITLSTGYGNVSHLRMLKTVTQSVPCSSAPCICPGNCLTYQNKTNDCQPQDCWSWDKMNNKCEPAGKDFVAPMVLQSIPFTGAFGAGWGNMGRWDIFTIYMGIVFGPLTIVVLACCCAMAGFCAQNEDRLEFWNCIGSCFGCLWSAAIVAMWIWGIVAIANKPLAPWTDWQGLEILCPLV